MRKARGVRSTAGLTALFAALAVAACEVTLGGAPRTADDEHGDGLVSQASLVSSEDGLVSSGEGLVSEASLVSPEDGRVSEASYVSSEDASEVSLAAPEGGLAPDEASAVSGTSEGRGVNQSLPWEPVETDWCSQGWIGLDEHTCFHVPETAAADAPILYVLHGVMAPDTLPVGLQEIAARAADALGVVAVFPKGKQGLCTWDPSVGRSLCWPTRRELVDTEAPALLAAWMRAEARLSQVLGRTFSRRYLIGFSNGGYFASYIALEGLLEIGGAGLVGAGRSIIEEDLFSQERPPIYIAVGELEIAAVIASAENLADMLTQHGWEHTLVVHPGRRHEIQGDDFLLAWETWTAR